MTRRRDPCNILIAVLVAVLFGVMAMAFIVKPPARPCPPTSIERLLTQCEARP